MLLCWITVLLRYDIVNSFVILGVIMQKKISLLLQKGKKEKKRINLLNHKKHYG
jgi:hypothetical protein